MAGFYEGEGSISNDISNNYRLRMSISQNDPAPLYLAQQKWGGSVRKRTRVSLKGKICHGNEWRLCHNKSLVFFKDIRPFMIIPYKIQQLDIAFQRFKNPIKRRFKCKFCDNDYASPSGRRRHEKKEHSSASLPEQARHLEAGNSLES